MDKKLYLNPVAEAEQGIAEFIRELPAVSAIFDGKKDAVAVFAATQEGAAALLSRKIQSGLRMAVVVGFQGTEEVLHAYPHLPAKVVFNVQVSSPGVLASNAIRATTDVGCAIVNALDGVQFGEPFVEKFPVALRSWTHNADEGGKLVSTLEFVAAIELRRRG